MSYIILHDDIGPVIEDIWGAVGVIYESERGITLIFIRLGIISSEWIGNVKNYANTIIRIANYGVNILELKEGIIRIFSLDYGMIMSRKGVNSSGLAKHE